MCPPIIPTFPPIGAGQFSTHLLQKPTWTEYADWDGDRILFPAATGSG
jgi:hypothetical protein